MDEIDIVKAELNIIRTQAEVMLNLLRAGGRCHPDVLYQIEQNVYHAKESAVEMAHLL